MKRLSFGDCFLLLFSLEMTNDRVCVAHQANGFKLCLSCCFTHRFCCLHAKHGFIFDTADTDFRATSLVAFGFCTNHHKKFVHLAVVLGRCIPMRKKHRIRVRLMQKCLSAMQNKNPQKGECSLPLFWPNRPVNESFWCEFDSSSANIKNPCLFVASTVAASEH